MLAVQGRKHSLFLGIESRAVELYHFSDVGDIEVFVPRAPLRHPHAEPLVYAMSEWESPLYLFPRDCPRIATWVTGETTEADCEDFFARGPARIKCFIDRGFELRWRTGLIYRYTFDSEGFENCHDYGDWICRTAQRPIRVELIDNLPAAAEMHGMLVEVVDSLVDLGHRVYDFTAMRWTTTLHVSMVRMGLLPGWEHSTSKPVRTGVKH